MKIIDVMWFSANEPVGIVLINNGYDNIAYVKGVKGDSEKEDIQDIIDYGTKIPASYAKKLSDFLNEK